MRGTAMENQLASLLLYWFARSLVSPMTLRPSRATSSQCLIMRAVATSPITKVRVTGTSRKSRAASGADHLHGLIGSGAGGCASIAYVIAHS
jgi:hypothetical protein